jgi:DNA-binding transcriptional regulator YdaS (Cro superfamily)
LDFFENIKEGNFVCSKCGGIISDDTRRSGYWVRKYRNRDISGYWLSHLICPWISAKEIEEQYRTKSKAYFYNFVLGLPYAGSDILVNADLILKCVDDSINQKDNVVMGVDVGLTKHFVLMNRTGVFQVGTTDNWEDINKLIRLYDISSCVIDAMPDQTEPRKLRDKYPGKVYLCWFKREIKKADFIQWDEKTRSVYADRSSIIEDVINKLVNRQIRYQVDPRELETYCRHWSNLYKIKETDSLGIERDVWESNGEDHFVFAQVYACIALRNIGLSETEVMSYKPVISPFKGNYAPDLSEIAKRQ